MARVKELMMNVLEVIALGKELDNPALAGEEYSHVWQVWEDGELTMQKCGELLWRRSLHMMKPGLGLLAAGVGVNVQMPHSRGAHSFAFVTEADGKRIRAAIAEAYGITDPYRF